MTRIVAVQGGLGEPSSSRLLTDQIVSTISHHLPEATVEVVDLRPLAHDITDAVLSRYASARLQHVIDQVAAADALVMTTPVFQASYSGLWKMFIDVLESDWLIGKPVLLAATGGTARHSMVIDHAMRPLFGYLQALTVPTGVFASPYDWGSDGSSALSQRVDRAVGELVSLLAGQGTGRSHEDEIDLFSDTMLSIREGG